MPVVTNQRWLDDSVNVSSSIKCLQVITQQLFKLYCSFIVLIKKKFILLGWPSVITWRSLKSELRRMHLASLKSTEKGSVCLKNGSCWVAGADSGILEQKPKWVKTLPQMPRLLLKNSQQTGSNINFQSFTTKMQTTKRIWLKREKKLINCAPEVRIPPYISGSLNEFWLGWLVEFKTYHWKYDFPTCSGDF